MISCSFDQSLMEKERFEWLLLIDELSGVLPHTFALDGLIDDIGGEFHVDVVDEGVEMLIDEIEIVLGVLSGQIDVLEHLFCFQIHWMLFEMEDYYLCHSNTIYTLLIHTLHSICICKLYIITLYL